MTDILENNKALGDMLTRIRAAQSLVSQAQKIADKYGFSFYLHPYGQFRGDLTVKQAEAYKADELLFKELDTDTQEHIEEVLDYGRDHSSEDDYESWNTSFC